MIVVTLITLFVLALLIYVMVRFNARSNPVPSRTSHNTLVEVVWTVVPISDPRRHRGAVLLAALRPARSGARDSRLRSGDRSAADHQGDRQPVVLDLRLSRQRRHSFDSLMLSDEERAADPDAGPRLLATNNELVVPTGRVIRMQVIGADVIHAFAVPAFGIKIDAIPGRLNETWFRVDREGIYYGQCSELCGRNHAFMPIAVRAVSEDVFEAWANGGDRSRRRPTTCWRRQPGERNSRRRS
jgi:cytochrome c oxidase subunit II